MPPSTFVRASWVSALCGVLVLAHLLATQPRSVADLGLFYFLAGYLGIVAAVVAAGTLDLRPGKIEAEGLRPAVVGHAISGAVVLLLFIRTTLPGAAGLELVFVPLGFSIGQLPVMWALVARRSGGMP